MRRHEIARIVEVSSSLFAPVDEAVMADDLERNPAPVLGESHSTVGDAGYEAQFIELTK